jgi:hypothetical protein
MVAVTQAIIVFPPILHLGRGALLKIAIGGRHRRSWFAGIGGVTRLTVLGGAAVERASRPEAQSSRDHGKRGRRAYFAKVHRSRSLPEKDNNKTRRRDWWIAAQSGNRRFLSSGAGAAFVCHKIANSLVAKTRHAPADEVVFGMEAGRSQGDEDVHEKGFHPLAGHCNGLLAEADVTAGD